MACADVRADDKDGKKNQDELAVLLVELQGGGKDILHDIGGVHYDCFCMINKIYTLSHKSHRKLAATHILKVLHNDM